VGAREDRGGEGAARAEGARGRRRRRSQQPLLFSLLLSRGRDLWFGGGRQVSFAQLIHVRLRWMKIND
jgi:hypothetical protein